MKSSIGLFYQLVVTDKNGKVVRKTRLRRSKSFILAFLKILEANFNTLGGAVPVKDVLGASEDAVYTYTTLFATAANAGVVDTGIVLGTGTTSPASDDYVMETKIAHGGAAGQLNYGSQSFIAAQEVGANVDLQLVRAFTNSSGGVINVTEAGVQCALAASKYALLIRDVFTAVPVADAETITVTYTVRTTV